jgi:hypothetical protein
MFKNIDSIYIAIIALCLWLGLFFSYQTAHAGVFEWVYGTRTVVVEPQPTRNSYKLGEKIEADVIKDIISHYATGTKAYGMERTIYCESHYWNVQSNIINKKGVREDSWGITQINLYWNPSVTKEQALDPEFAIKWMSERWGKTRWYGWNHITDSCNPIYL